ncbi:putative transcriptional regulator (plasmid) [Mycolicibacterium chubuense NBB4]|uniref:Putative transcriptional regulator n=2 Tax=Mycolicibacterium chubuense TaxID=1800 RepID=I4BSB4_MYCCN|nr:putative transcriptional regulator [Mycolicibacterium chubuense NBB4]
MTTRTVIRWNLRQLMAQNGMFATTDLVAPLHERGVEISRQMVHRIATKPPQRINLDLLAALCDILSCTPNDLLEVVQEQIRETPAVNDSGPGIGELRPIRVTIRRPSDNQ